jgi:hypothetical protein
MQLFSIGVRNDIFVEPEVGFRQFCPKMRIFKEKPIRNKQLLQQDTHIGTSGTGIAFLIYMNRAYEQTNIGRFKMKKILVVMMVLMVGIIFVNPTLGYSDPWNRYTGQVRGPVVNDYRHYDRRPSPTQNTVRYERSRSNNDGLLIAGIALGGIALGAILGSVMSQPRVTKEVVYNNPAYTQPSAYDNDTPPGEWVTVAGQWVNGKWVPAHNVWVPVNP